MKHSKSTNEPASLVKTISIVVPVYNVQPYLRECLDSVLAQTVPHLEIVCVDDGSTDGSAAILDEYAKKDDRIRVIRQPNGGLSAARNAGMDAATGTYLYFLDSDDALASNAMERLMSLAETNNLDQILFGTELVAEPGAATNDRLADMQRYYTAPAELANRILPGPDLFSALVGANAFFASVPLRFFRRNAIPDGLRFPVGLLHEDNYFSPLAMLAARTAVVIPDRFYRRRVRSGSIMTNAENTERHATDMMAIYRLLGKARKTGRISKTARPAFDAFRRELYRLHLGYSPRKTNWGARAIDVFRAFGYRGLVRSIVRKIVP